MRHVLDHPSLKKPLLVKTSTCSEEMTHSAAAPWDSKWYMGDTLWYAA